MKLAFCLALAALSALPLAVPAQTIYRCGNEYSRVPCNNGKPIGTDDGAASAKETAEARRLAERERRLGNDMEKSRLRREAALKPAMPSSLSAPPKPPVPAASASLKPKKKARGKIRVVDEGDFVAKVPKAKKQADR